GVARADDHDLTAVERRENFLGKFHGDRADGDAAALNIRLRADLFGDVECFLKGLIEAAAAGTVFEREAVGFFKLAEDFSFAEHHGVEAGSDFEKMFEAVRLGKSIKFVGQRVAVLVAIHQKFAKSGKGAARLHRRDGIKFDTIAGRENNS